MENFINHIKQKREEEIARANIPASFVVQLLNLENEVRMRRQVIESLALKGAYDMVKGNLAWIGNSVANIYEKVEELEKLDKDDCGCIPNLTEEELDLYLKDIGGLLYNDKEVFHCAAFSIGPGWYGLVKKLIEEALALGWDKRITQVKEKFGIIRFYIESGPTEVFKVLQKYEDMSHKVCEECGDPGEARSPNGWIKTLCDKCEKRQ